MEFMIIRGAQLFYRLPYLFNFLFCSRLQKQPETGILAGLPCRRLIAPIHATQHVTTAKSIKCKISHLGSENKNETSALNLCWPVTNVVHQSCKACLRNKTSATIFTVFVSISLIFC